MSKKLTKQMKEAKDIGQVRKIAGHFLKAKANKPQDAQLEERFWQAWDRAIDRFK